MHNVGELIGALSKGKGAKFASFFYRTRETGELAKYLVILGAETRTLYEKDVEMLRHLLIDARSCMNGLTQLAVADILRSREESLAKGIGNNSRYTNADTYVHLADVPLGIKIHKETGDVHVSALVERKDVWEPGEKRKPVKSAPLTIEKNRIRYMLPSGRFRQFALSNVTVARVNGDTLELE